MLVSFLFYRWAAETQRSCPFSKVQSQDWNLVSNVKAHALLTTRLLINERVND